MSELELLRQVALKALEMFGSDDMWIDGFYAEHRAMELAQLLEKWKSDYPLVTEEVTNE